MSVLLVAKNELIRSLKNKKKLLLMIIVPLISIICALGINDFMKPSLNIGVIDNSNTAENFKEKVESVGGIKVNIANKDTINTDMILAKYAVVIEFDNKGNYEVKCLDSSMKSIIEGSVKEVLVDGSGLRLNGIIKDIKKNSIDYAERGAAFIFLTLMISSIIVACNMLKDNKAGLIKRYTISPNKIESYVLGNYIYNLFSASFQVIVSILIIYILNINIGISLMNFIIIGILISVITTSIATLIAVLSSSELQASLLASSIALITSLLGGAFLPLDKMPDAIKFISNLSITKWIMEISKSIEGGMGYNNNFTIIILLVFISIIMIIIAIKISRERFA